MDGTGTHLEGLQLQLQNAVGLMQIRKVTITTLAIVAAAPLALLSTHTRFCTSGLGVVFVAAQPFTGTIYENTAVYRLQTVSSAHYAHPSKMFRVCIMVLVGRAGGRPIVDVTLPGEGDPFPSTNLTLRGFKLKRP
jgi:hypothetical protein